MRRSTTAARLALTTIILTILSFANTVRAACTQPPIIRFLTDYARMLNEDSIIPYSEADAFAVYQNLSGSTRLRWMGVHWLAPDGGALFLINCKGNALAAATLGGVTVIARELTVADGSLATPVSYISGSGTGLRLNSVSFVEYDDSKVRMLWTHYTNESYSDEFHHYSRASSWVLSRDKQRIEVTLVAMAEEGRSRHEKLGVPSIAHESYCWNENLRAYNKCSKS